MKQFMNKLALLAIALFGAVSAGGSGEFDYASYAQTTFQDIVMEEQRHSYGRAETGKAAEDIQLECKVAKYRVSCGYSDMQRPISGKKKMAIRLWVETLKIDPELASLYRQEIRVTEGGRLYWIPIQEQLFSHIDQELARNDTIELFIIFIGRVESGLVFIATEFEKPVLQTRHSIRETAWTRTSP